MQNPVSPDLPVVARIPLEERLWTVQIGDGSTEPFPGESAELKKACGDFSGRTFEVWQACMAKHLKPARYAIAPVHAAPNWSSDVIATIFEERRIHTDNHVEFVWTVERASHPGERLAWPDAIHAFDYGLHIAGVQRRNDWVRLLRSLPVDGWLRIPPENTAAAIHLWVSSVEGQILDLSPLIATSPDGRRRRIEGGSYLIQRVDKGSVQFRAEIPSDFDCGELVTDPVRLPPTLTAPVAEFFDENKQPRFFTTYTKGC